MYIFSVLLSSTKERFAELILCVVIPEIILKERWVSVMKLDMCFLLGDCSDLNKPFHAGINTWGNLQVMKIEMAAVYLHVIGCCK